MHKKEEPSKFTIFCFINLERKKLKAYICNESCQDKVLAIGLQMSTRTTTQASRNKCITKHQYQFDALYGHFVELQLVSKAQSRNVTNSYRFP